MSTQATLDVPPPSTPPTPPPAPPAAAQPTPAAAGQPGRGLRGLPGTFWIVFAGVISNRVGDMVVPFLVFFLGSRGLSTGQTGLVAIALGAGGLVGPALGGLLTDRIGHRTALLIGLVATPASLGALFAAPGPALLAVAAALLGVTGRIYLPAGGALVIAVVGAADRARAMSLIHWAVNIGTAVAASSAGFLAARGYGLLFALDALTCLVYAGIVLFGVAPDSGRTPTGTAPQADGTGYRVVLRDRLMVAFTALSLVSVLVYSMTEFAIPLSIRSHGLPPTVFGFAAVVNAGLVVLLQPLLYPVLSRLPRLAVLATAWALIALGVAATGLATRPWHYLLTTVVWSVGEVGSAVVSGGIVADLAPPHARGRYQGAFGWAWAAARLLSLSLTTGILAVAGPAALWGTVGVLGVAAAVALLRLTPALRARTGQA